MKVCMKIWLGIDKVHLRFMSMTCKLQDSQTLGFQGHVVEDLLSVDLGIGMPVVGRVYGEV
jgi:hypothetical protein